MRLIDADVLRKQFEDRTLEDFTCYLFLSAIDKAPTVADHSRELVKKSIELGRNVGYYEGKTERPQGEWGKHGECPFCSYIRKCKEDNFCGNCGAKMVGGES